MGTRYSARNQTIYATLHGATQPLCWECNHTHNLHAPFVRGGSTGAVCRVCQHRHFTLKPYIGTRKQGMYLTYALANCYRKGE